MPRSALLVALLLFAVLDAATPAMATRGLPLLQRYTAAEIPAAPGHSAIVSDERGVIYVGNGEGVLRFTGGEWELIPLPGRRGARSLLRAWDGPISVAIYLRDADLPDLATGLERLDIPHATPLSIHAVFRPSGS